MPACFRLLASLLITMAVLLCPAHAQTFTLLYSFTTDGGGPVGQLILDHSGNLFGATNFGGDESACKLGCGLVFKLDPNGTLTVLHTFMGKDGWAPEGNMASDGSSLYGTTGDGGNLQDCTYDGVQYGCGVVFKLDPETQQYTLLYKFAGGTDGAGPNDVIRDSAGNLYGTTGAGGNAGCGEGNTCGTIFKLDSSGQHTVLYTFTGGADGGKPIAVTRDDVGNLYGTTFSGGDLKCNPLGVYPGCGTVFELTASGTFKVLHTFTDGRDGDNGSDVGVSSSGVIREPGTGNLLGTSPFGGLRKCTGYPGCGVVFSLAPGGKETELYSFSGNVIGGVPEYPLTSDSAGNLYSTTTFGGDLFGCPSGCGTVFKLDPNGNYTALYAFTNGVDGYYPTYVVSDPSGTLYGETVGSSGSAGTIFKITP